MLHLRLVFLVGAMLTLRGFVVADDLPPLRIAAPERVEVGELVVIEGVGPIGDARRWIVLGLPEGDYLVDSSGRRVIFSTRTAGVVGFVLVTALSGDSVPELHVARASVTVGDPSPGPSPPPDPSPDPDLPEGQYGLAAAAYRVARQLPEGERSQSWAAAAAFRSVSSQIAAGVLTDPQTAIGKLGELLTHRLGEHHAAWKPVRTTIAGRLAELNRNGSITTVADLQTAFEEVATGLEAVR